MVSIYAYVRSEKPMDIYVYIYRSMEKPNYGSAQLTMVSRYTICIRALGKAHGHICIYRSMEKPNYGSA